MGDENPIRTLGDYSRPSHEGYRNTIELPKGNNMDPSTWKDLLPIPCSILSTGRTAYSAMIPDVPTSSHGRSHPKHGLVSRTYSKKSLIMASIFGFKSKSFMTMSIRPQDEHE
ncbi:hypothetical protein Tco_1570685 [Tanacetum coccineum]